MWLGWAGLAKWGCHLLRHADREVLHGVLLSKCAAWCRRACAATWAVLQTVGRYHLGEFVNRFQPGSLVMRLPDSGTKYD